MEPTPAGTSLRTEFHAQLDQLRDEIAAMAAAVTESIPRATEILLGQDLEGAEYMILADDAVDARALELEERCYQMLALQSPVASDLRRIVAALRIIADVERSADLAVNVCKAARRIYGKRLDPRLRGIIQKMGDQARQLFQEATEAYLTADVARASAIADMDEYLDDLQREFVAGDLHEPRRRAARSAGGGAARGRRPLLRAHRRPCRQHRRTGALPRHGVDARAARCCSLRRAPGGERPGMT